MTSSLVKKYLQDAQQRANQKYLNADGFADNDLNFVAENGFFNAGGPMSGIPRSQPYVITLTNVSAAIVNNFDIFGAYQYLQATGFSAGSLTISGVTISSSLPNVTYQELLYQSMNSPFSIGTTYVQSSTSGQITQPIQVVTKDANGNEAKKPLIPAIDPYQNQTTVLTINLPFRIDGYTKLTTNILASATIIFQFYPADNINLARGLAGSNVSRQFGDPGIVRSSVAVLPDGTGIKSRLGG